MSAGTLDLVQIQVGQLNWLKRGNRKGRVILGFLSFDLLFLLFVSEDVFFEGFRGFFFRIEAHIIDFDNAPDAAHQKFFIMNHQVRGHFKGVHPQVCKARDVFIFAFYQGNGDLVDDRILAVFFDFRFYGFALIRADIVFAQDSPNLSKADFNGFLVVCGAIHAQQVFQHICRNVRALFHQGGQIFSNDHAREKFQNFFIKGIHKLRPPFYRLKIEIECSGKRQFHTE